MIRSLQWYEWLGWFVELLIVTLAVVFVAYNVAEGALRATLISIGGFTVVIGIWTWVLMWYGKKRTVAYGISLCRKSFLTPFPRFCSCSWLAGSP